MRYKVILEKITSTQIATNSLPEQPLRRAVDVNPPVSGTVPESWEATV
jgi:hypothetical protein